MSTVDSNSYKLLTILQSYAKTGADQQKAADFYNSAARDQIGEDALTKVMAGALYDGLAYGNWPWN